MATKTLNQKFGVGTRVRDTVSHARGTVVYHYTEPGIEDLVAVQFDGRDAPLAYHVEDLELVR
jgi:hypothetical protein